MMRITIQQDGNNGRRKWAKVGFSLEENGGNVLWISHYVYNYLYDGFSL